MILLKAKKPKLTVPSIGQMVTIAIANKKGGVGKTSIARELAAIFADLGLRILVVDVDTQCEISDLWDVHDPPLSIYDVLVARGQNEKKVGIADIVVQVKENIWLAPAHGYLKLFEVGEGRLVRAEYSLKDALEQVKKLFDITLIDCPPATGRLHTNALVASEGVIIPCRPSLADISGLGRYLGEVDEIRESVNPNLEIIGIVLTFFRGFNKDKETMAQIISEDLAIFNTTIGEYVAARDALDAGTTVYEMYPTHKLAMQYMGIAQEVLNWISSR